MIDNKNVCSYYRVIHFLCWGVYQSSVRQSIQKEEYEMADITEELVTIRTDKEIGGAVADSLEKINGDIQRITNAGIDYPLQLTYDVLTNTKDYSVLVNGILDVQVLNANISMTYSMRYISKNGGFDDLIIFTRTNPDTGVTEDLQKAVKVSYQDKDTENFSKWLTIPSTDGNPEIFRVLIDYSAIPEGFQAVQLPNTPFKSNKVAAEKLFPLLDEEETHVYMDKTNNMVQVGSRYSSMNNLIFTFKPYGINQIMSIYEVYKLPRVLPFTFKETEGAEKIPMGGPTNTDWLSPHKLVALADGDNPTNGNVYTGGTHGTAGGSGDPTARTREWRVFVDDSPLVSSSPVSVAGKVVTIEVVNEIEASNTHVTARRYVLEEKVRYKISGTHIEVQVFHHFKEACTWKEYYGLETVGYYYTSMWIPDSALKNYTDIPQGAGGSIIGSGAKLDYPLVDRRIVRNASNTDELTVQIDSSFGLGTGSYVADTTNLMEARTYGKTYSNLISLPLTVKKGEVYSFKGSYTFTPGGNLD